MGQTVFQKKIPSRHCWSSDRPACGPISPKPPPPPCTSPQHYHHHHIDSNCLTLSHLLGPTLWLGGGATGPKQLLNFNRLALAHNQMFGSGRCCVLVMDQHRGGPRTTLDRTIPSTRRTLAGGMPSTRKLGGGGGGTPAYSPTPTDPAWGSHIWAFPYCMPQQTDPNAMKWCELYLAIAIRVSRQQRPSLTLNPPVP